MLAIGTPAKEDRVAGAGLLESALDRPEWSAERSGGLIIAVGGHAEFGGVGGRHRRQQQGAEDDREGERVLHGRFLPQAMSAFSTAVSSFALAGFYTKRFVALPGPARRWLDQ